MDITYLTKPPYNLTPKAILARVVLYRARLSDKPTVFISPADLADRKPSTVLAAMEKAMSAGLKAELAVQAGEKPGVRIGRWTTHLAKPTASAAAKTYKTTIKLHAAPDAVVVEPKEDKIP